MMKLANDSIKKKWIIGVSGGSDSMALLDLCYHSNMNIIVAHMNYQLRDTADRDMHIVQTYCDKKSIPCHVKYQSDPCVHNFQDFARRKRYAFYHELLTKYQAYGVLIAHQMDDVLETYLMQKQRKSIPEYYGIKKETTILQCLVKRPLLAYTKDDLKEYCIRNKVPYGDDESNFSRKYTRNRIRMDVIQKMSVNDKKELLQKIEHENIVLIEDRQKITTFYKEWNGSIQELQTLPIESQLAILDKMIFDAVHAHVSRKERMQIVDSLHHQNFQRKIHGKILQSSYGCLHMVEEPKDYEYVIHDKKYFDTPYFKIRDHGTTIEAITLKKTDFPLIIRNVKPQDKIRLRFGTKSIHRWFIDRKIPANERKIWPVVENAQRNIIFVPKIGCDIEHFSNNPTLFVIK